MSSYMQEIWQRNAGTCHQNEPTLWFSHTVDTSTTHRAPAIIHIPCQVKHAASAISLPLAKVQKYNVVTLANFDMQISASEKAAINTQTVHFVCPTNFLFSIAEHPELIKLQSMLQPSYSSPNRQHVSDKLFSEVYELMQSECKDKFEDQNMLMMLESWSNVHNEPIICVSVTTPDGQSYLTETVDTCGQGHIYKTSLHLL